MNMKIDPRIYAFLLSMLIVGVASGYALISIAPSSLITRSPERIITKKINDPSAFQLPRDAVVIQSCSDHRGKLYIRPQDIPMGPVYMVYNNRIIGIEYMLEKEDFMTGRSYDNLLAMNMQIDHMDTGLLSNGHIGFVKPHYHIDLYAVDRQFEDAIICNKT